jgi:hypothetical protein
MRNLLAKLALSVMVLSGTAVLLAQDSSSMTGVVTDATGAVIPGAVVTLSNPSTGVTFTQTTDNSGSYRFPSVAPGPGYRATFTHDGFSPALVSDITLNVGLTRTQNVHLVVGGEQQTVAVSAGDQTVTLDTTDATIGNNINPEQLNQLPIYDRTAGISVLFYQQAGVDSSQGAVTGARIDQSEVIVDGLDANDVASGQTFAVVGQAPVDSVQQFTGSVAGLNSSAGTGSGAQFQLVTKNGTNKFHGNLNEYHRDTTTEANTWFNNLTGIPRTPLIRNQFGADLGGPVKRDKLFFYFDWADSRIVQSSTAERLVPLPASDGGLLAGTLNYINSGTNCGDSSRITTSPGCITTLSPAQLKALDPAGAGLDAAELSYISARYPAANDLSRGDGVNTGGYRFVYATPDTQHTYVSRVDYTITSTQSVFGRFTIDRENATESLPEFPSDPVTHPFQNNSYGYVVSHVWDIGKNKVNQFYFGDNISKLNFPDLYNPLGANQPSFSGLDGPYTAFDGQKRRVPVPIVRDDFTWQKGNHSLTFGGTFKWIKTNSNLITNFNFPGIGLKGTALSGGLCGPTPGDCDPANPAESLRPNDINEGAQSVGINDYDQLFATGLGVIGTISTNYSYNNKQVAQLAGSGAPRAYRYYQTEAYFGDTWKVKSNLTLAYGVRYQFYSVPYEAHGSESVPTPILLNTYIQDRLAQGKAGNTSNTGLPLYSYVLGGKVNNGPDLYAPNYKDFGPHVSFAFTPYRDGKTVVNGGASIVYDRTVINAINFLQDQVPNIFGNQQINQFGSTNQYTSIQSDTRVGADLAYPASLNPPPAPSTLPYVPFVDSTGTPYGLANGETGFEISPNLKDPYNIDLNAGVQQELPGHMILKLNYVGRLGRRLIADADGSQVIDVPDYTGKSTQSMSQAFAGLTSQMRAGVANANLTAQPWFEDVLGHISSQRSNTYIVAALGGQLPKRGDISDTLQTLAAYTYFLYPNLLPTNIGIPSQFGTNAYLTNLGSSNYHGMLVTLDKNMSNGLRFEFNYTWSHSIDNTSVSANDNALFSNSNLICDVLQPRACRGDSDFDVRQEISSNFLWEVPVGRGKLLLANAPRALDEALGGWSFSGLPIYRTGLPFSATSDAFLASFDNLDPAIFTGNKGDLKTKVNIDDSSNTVYMFPGGPTGAAKVLSEFRGPLGLEYGQRNLIRGAGAFFLDAGLGKKFPIIEDKLNLNFRADAFNVLNHPAFGPTSAGNAAFLSNNANLDIVNSASQFGQITNTATSPGATNSGARVAQFSLRLEF